MCMQVYAYTLQRFIPAGILALDVGQLLGQRLGLFSEVLMEDLEFVKTCNKCAACQLHASIPEYTYERRIIYVYDHLRLHLKFVKTCNIGIMSRDEVHKVNRPATHSKHIRNTLKSHRPGVSLYTVESTFFF